MNVARVVLRRWRACGVLLAAAAMAFGCGAEDPIEPTPNAPGDEPESQIFEAAVPQESFDFRLERGRSRVDVPPRQTGPSAEGLAEWRDDTLVLTGRGTGRPEGATEFVSADASNGQNTEENRTDDESYAGAEPAADADGAGESERSVEEGDIYRVLEGSLILNLNAYRGLQIIDFADVYDPEIIGRLQVSGSPVELYAVGDRAFVLLNNWRGYYGSRYDAEVETRNGGLVLSVDLSDPAHPRVLDQSYVPGYIRKSRLTRGGGAAALYVVTGGYTQWQDEDGSWVWDTRTVVMSFNVSTGALEKRGQLNLGGYVTDIQATTEALLVARYDYSTDRYRSRVSVIDISDPHGAMVEGDEVLTAGQVRNQFNMDLFNGVLRVVSDGSWEEQINHIETWDADDIHNLHPIDHQRFGANEDLFATLFLGNKAFFVTYFRTDPFHAFFIDDEGNATEMSEFIVSGWNDFFRPVLNETRLIGIGVNDDSSRTMSVSLYDIVDLTNPEPLVARANVSAHSSWSEARWDHRAFSVLDGAVAIEAPDGTLETGLVLLPFSGWNDDWDRYTAAVQIFTFSESTLTRRGVMDHGTPVRRSFLAEEATTANLSEAQLSLFDTLDPDDPLELGRVDLAPNYTDYFDFGTYAARVRNARDYYYYWWDSRAELPPTTVEIIPKGAHPDTATPVAQIEVPADAAVYQSGDKLIVVQMTRVDGSEWPYTYETEITVWDLSYPRWPQLEGRLTTDQLHPGYYGYYYDEMCWSCGYSYGGSTIESVEGGLVFLQRIQERELLGIEERCNLYPAEPNDCWTSTGWADDCVYYSGSRRCTQLEDEAPECYGDIYECTTDATDGVSCEVIDPESIETRESCWEYERYRYWQRFVLDVLDTSEVELAESIELPSENEGVGMVVDESDVWVSFRRPAEVEGDTRSYVAYFAQRVALDEPLAPELGAPINVPGQLLAVDGDTIFTRDTVWGEEIVETAVARLIVYDDLAYLQAFRRLPDQVVASLTLDGAGHVLASHRLAYQVTDRYEEPDTSQQLTVMDALGDLDLLATVPVDSWASLREAREGRALFQVPGGLLVFNLDEPTAPYPQAYFATRGWPREVLVNSLDQIIFAAGRYGIYRFDMDEFNLLELE